MLPIKKIISPTDFSTPAEKGLQTAVELAQHFDAELVIVHVLIPVPMVSASAVHLPTIMNSMADSAEKSMDELLRDQVPSDIKSSYHIVEGRAADQIAKIADQEKADLIVIATHGESGIQNFIFGSVTERTVRIARCPVLTIRPTE